MVFGNGVKNIQAAAYNGARTVFIHDGKVIKSPMWACWSQVEYIYTLGKRKNWATEELKTAVCKLISLRSLKVYESLLTATMSTKSQISFSNIWLKCDQD